MQDGKIGPCPLCKITDFVNFDADARPGPAARVEQSHVYNVWGECVSQGRAFHAILQ